MSQTAIHIYGTRSASNCKYLACPIYVTPRKYVTIAKTKVFCLYDVSKWLRLNKPSYNQTQTFQKRFLLPGITLKFLFFNLSAILSPLNCKRNSGTAKVKRHLTRTIERRV